MFQAMFAIITPALILGAVAERMKFSAFVAFISIWLLLVYCPIAHMVWAAEGWIFKAERDRLRRRPRRAHVERILGARGRAHGSASAAAIGKEPMAPHSLPLCLIGAGLLWTGWFGFNAGSALSASGLAALAFTNTSTATSMAVVTWAAIEWLHRGKPTALGAATAAVAGLVAITPACGNVSPLGSIAVGGGVACVCYFAVTFLKPAFGYDDSLDAFGVHGLGGAWGALASGIFATTLGTGIESNAAQILVQLKGIAFVAVFAPVMTVIILSALSWCSVRCGSTRRPRLEGLDLSEHSEAAYTRWVGGSSIAIPAAAASGSESIVPGVLAHSAAE